MSWQASAYVKDLETCPDGTPLNRGQKFLALILADYHNTDRRAAWPSIPTLAREALTSRSQIKRDLIFLEEHFLIRKLQPEKMGRGWICAYQFMALDAKEELKTLLAKGGHHEPLFSGQERGPEGVHHDQENGSEGVQKGFNGSTAIRKNEEQEQTIKLERENPPSSGHRLQQEERDSWDLRRWQEQMKTSEPHAGVYIPDPDKLWINRARAAAYEAGVSPSRLIALLKQHYPTDPKIDRIYADAGEKIA